MHNNDASDIQWNVWKFASELEFNSLFLPFFRFKLDIGMISAPQPHILSYIQFLDKENNDGNRRLGLLLCFTIVWSCAEIFPFLQLLCPLGGDATMIWKCESE